ITVVKNDPDGLLKTYNSVISEIGSGLKCSRWIIKLSSDADVSLKKIINLPDYCHVYTDYDKGIYSAFNQAISKIPSSHENEYVMFLNAGDEIINGQEINKLLDLQRDNIDIFIACAKIQGKEKIIYPISSLIGVGGLNFCHQSILYRVKILKEIPFPEKYKIAGDYAHYLKIQDRDKIICTLIISTFSLDGLSGRSVYKTRLENFKAGFEHNGIREIFNFVKMIIIRVLDKI
ncbi:TPA: hypothetical protein LAP07_004697, partial [Escherichia coli]|nr:hypothetical protein [Escherichia coli]